MKNEIELVGVEDLRGYERNARTHPKKQIEQLCRAITEFGFTNPILIDGSGMIIAGHGRLVAAKQLGMDEVPCIRLGHLGDEQVRALILADNRIAEGSGWNEKLLRAELDDLMKSGMDIEMLGFDAEEMFAENSGSPARVVDVKVEKPPAVAWCLVECPIAEFGKVQAVLDQLPDFVETYTTYTDERKD